MNRLHFVSVMLLILMLFAACTTQAPTPQQDNADQETANVIIDSPLGTPRAMVSMLPTVTPFSMPEDLENLEATPGQAVVIGRVLSSQTLMPIANTPVRLAEIYYADETKDPATAAWALNNAASPFAYSDANGLFVFENVPAQDYVVFVGDMEGRYAVATKEDGFPQAYRFEPDTVTNLGDINVDYTP
jgi:hypothetical protein